MPRFVAFLRAINVGGHTVRMERLRGFFESLGLTSVETFIASGNVAFETGTRSAASLEKRIQERLRDELGYEVATFIRTPSELAAIVAHRPFKRAELEGARALNIALLFATPDAGAKRRLAALRNAIDDFDVHGREVYWLCRRSQSRSTFSNRVLEKTLGMPATLRGADTVRALAEKYGPGAGR